MCYDMKSDYLFVLCNFSKVFKFTVYEYNIIMDEIKTNIAFANTHDCIHGL